MSRYSDGPEQETYHDIVEDEARHDYDPEPDYDRQDERRDAAESALPFWQRKGRLPTPPPVSPQDQ